MSKTIYVSSRKSQLAMVQTNEVIGMLEVGARIALVVDLNMD
jgi:porphobilinogen deaminase